MAAKTKSRTPARRPAKTKTPKVAPTREGLIAQAGDILDRVDALLPKLRSFYWTFPTNEPLGKLREELGRIVVSLNHVLISEPEEDRFAEHILRDALMAPAGTVPSAARPGTFVQWIGFVPVLCEWGGFLQREACLRVIDPAEPWLNETGYWSAGNMVPAPGYLDVDQLFRSAVNSIARGKKFKLYDVQEYGRNEAVARLAEHEWMRKALDQGPSVDALELPASFRSMQQTFFV